MPSRSAQRSEQRGLDDDLAGRGLFFQQVHGLVEVVVQWQGGWVELGHGRGGDGGRDEFGDFDAGAIELGAQRFGVGVDGGFGGAVSGHEGEGEEANAGADGNDGASATRE